MKGDADSKVTALGGPWSFSATIELLIADAAVARAYQGTANGKGEELAGSDWERFNAALGEETCVAFPLGGAQALALNLGVGHGIANVFAAAGALVIVEAFDEHDTDDDDDSDDDDGDDDDAEQDEDEEEGENEEEDGEDDDDENDDEDQPDEQLLTLASAPPEKDAKSLGTLDVKSGAIVIASSTESCVDAPLKAKLGKAVEFGEQESLVIGLAPGRYTLFVERAREGSRRARLVPAAS